VKELPIEWVEKPDPNRIPETELPSEAIETVIMLMARALVAIVRVSEEASDEH
jgi:hypothetical protein